MLMAVTVANNDVLTGVFLRIGFYSGGTGSGRLWGKAPMFSTLRRSSNVEHFLVSILANQEEGRRQEGGRGPARRQEGRG